MSRNIHLVGSVPLANAKDVFTQVSAALGPRLNRLPDGETGPRGDWITWLEPVFAENPAFVKSGEFFRVHSSGGTGRERYTLKPGLRVEDVHFANLFYADIAKAFLRRVQGVERRRQNPRRQQIPSRSGAGAFGDLVVPHRCAPCADRPAL